MNYILEGHKPVSCPDILEWARWFQTGDAARRVAEDFVGDVRISTVFLGIDHSFSRVGPPVLFETMVFAGPLDEEQDRYCTWDEAVAGHAAMLARVKALA